MFLLLHHAESLAEHEKKMQQKIQCRAFSASSLVEAQDEQQQRCNKHMVHAAFAEMLVLAPGQHCY